MPVTQKQIAELAGVSRGTVDRTLNNRGHVDPEVEKKIRQIAGELGYKPNRAGSQLVRTNRPLRLGVVIQSVETAFMNKVLQEIASIKEEMLEKGAELLIYPIEEINLERQLEVLSILEEEKVDGIALTPVENERVYMMINRLYEKGIPVVTFNTDLPVSKRLCYIGQDSYLSGRASAGLMNLLLNGKGKVLIVTGHLFNLSHQRRVEGFLSEIHRNYAEISVLPLEQCGDSRRKAYEIVRKRLEEDPEITGIYFSANGQSGACDAIRELMLRGKVHFVCHDLTDDNIEHVKEGIIDFFIDQDAHMQAIKPLEILLDYILTGTKPAKEYMLTKIEYINQYNL